MNKEKTSAAKAERSRISRQLITRYFISLAAYGAATLLLIFLSWRFCTLFIWYGTSPLYQFLQFVKNNIRIFVVLLALLGWTVITYRYITRSLGYLDEAVAAAEQMAVCTEEPIKLSPAMIDTENEMNLVREKALNDAHAAKEAEQRKNEMTVYLAHDLKTPLTSVIGYLTLLHDEPQTPPELRSKYTDIALGKAQRLEELINEFFEVTRFNLFRSEPVKETVNLSRMLEQITYEFNPTLLEKELFWKSELESGVYLDCDPDKLERVFDNLFRNAVSYSRRKTPLELSLVCRGGNAEIKIKNYGKTIPREQLSHIFEQFYRLDASRATESGGAGLGLAIAKEIAEQHGGSIAAESFDESVTFSVVLPGAFIKQSETPAS